MNNITNASFATQHQDETINPHATTSHFETIHPHATEN
jgi:hypothetical protein